MAKHTRPQIRAIERSFDIIEKLGKEKKVGVTQLSEDLKLPKSTVHNHLSTLRELGYVIKRDDTYEISLKFLALGGEARRKTPLFRIAQSEIDNLASDIGTNAYLWIEENNHLFIIYREKNDEINLGDFIGSSPPFTTTAAGKAILAHLPDDQVDTIIKEQGFPSPTKNAISDRESLLRELREVREQGYSISDGEQLSGLIAAGIPLTDPEGRVHGAISVMGPKQSNGSIFRQGLIDAVTDTAQRIELKLVESYTYVPMK